MVGVTVLVVLVLIGATALGLLLSLPSGQLSPEDLHAAVNVSSGHGVLRAFDSEDEKLVEGRPDLRRRLTAARRRVALAYLHELRLDYGRAWSVCRLLAPLSQDPTFISDLIKQFFAFQLRLGWIYAQCWAGYQPRSLESLKALTNVLTSQRQEAALLFAGASTETERLRR